MAATTSTFSLRRLIQTKLNPDDDTIIDDTASSYEDDLRNPIKKRLAAWLIPDQTRRGSNASAVQLRNSSDLARCSSPALPGPFIISDYNKPLPHAPSDSADLRMSATHDGTLASLPTSTTNFRSGIVDGGSNTAQDYYYHDERNTHHYPSQDLPLNPAPVTSGPSGTQQRFARLPSFSSTSSSSSLDSDHHLTLNSQYLQNSNQYRNSADNSNLVEDAPEPSPYTNRPMTFLFTPTPSHMSSPKDLMFPGPSDELLSMEPDRNSKEWSDGARQLMLETEQAFSAGTFDGLSTNFELRLPSISEPRTPHPIQEETDNSHHTEEKEREEAEQVANEETDVRRVSFPREVAEPKPTVEATHSSDTITAPLPTPPQPLEIPSEVSVSIPTPIIRDSTAVPNSPRRLSIWRKPQEVTAVARRDSHTRRSMESQDDASRRRSRHDSVDTQSEKRQSQSVPPPLPPRRSSLETTLEEARPPRTPTAPATSFNVTPAIRKSPSPSTTKPSQQASRPPPPSNYQQPPSKFNVNGSRRPSKITRWGLSEGVADILTGQRFKKIEADEMLTPEQLAKLKKEREESRRKQQIESRKAAERAAEMKRLAEIERQVEISSSESERDTSRNRGSDRDSDSSSSHSLSDKPRVSRDHLQVPPRRVLSDDIGDVDDDDNDSMTGLATVDLLGSPSSRSSATFPNGTSIPPGPVSAPPTAKLPPIPRGTSTKRKSAGKRQKSSNSLMPEEDEECFYFKSTPYSLMLPTYRHGPIAFTKSEMGIGRGGALTMDDTLDWTAFQMAILGAGDIMPEVYDDEDPRFSEEVVTWFNTLGFDSHGQLVPESAPSPRSSSHSTVSTAPTEASIPAPSFGPSFGDTSSLWASPAFGGETYDTTKLFQGNGHKRWTMKDMPPLEPAGDKRNISTPPCSPGMPMVVGSEDDEGRIALSTHQAASEEKEVAEGDVQMGFNLNNDLGDFLKWEAQHAFGPGYYGAH